MNENTGPHKHKCMRCGNEFDCQTPDVCTAQYAVLPSIVVRGENGPEVREHCRQVWVPCPEFS